jgi:hypothetical protein
LAPAVKVAVVVESRDPLGVSDYHDIRIERPQLASVDVYDI